MQILGPRLHVHRCPVRLRNIREGSGACVCVGVQAVFLGTGLEDSCGKGEMEAQRGGATCPGLLSKQVAAPGLNGGRSAPELQRSWEHSCPSRSGPL